MFPLMHMPVASVRIVHFFTFSIATRLMQFLIENTVELSLNLNALLCCLFLKIYNGVAEIH